MLNPFIDLLGAVIHIYSLVIIAWVVLSLLIQFEVVNRYNRLVSQIFSILSQMVEPALIPLRRLQHKLLPQLTAVDLSPLILLLLLGFINNALYTWFYNPQPYGKYDDKVMEEQVRALNKALTDAAEDAKKR